MIDEIQRQADTIYDRAEQRDRELAELMVRAKLATATAAMLRAWMAVVARGVLRAWPSGTIDLGAAQVDLCNAHGIIDAFSDAWSSAPDNIERQRVIDIVIEGWADSMGFNDASAIYVSTSRNFLLRMLNSSSPQPSIWE
jgi:hypothetical protein